jgi:hypothetical protein
MVALMMAGGLVAVRRAEGVGRRRWWGVAHVRVDVRVLEMAAVAMVTCPLSPPMVTVTAMAVHCSLHIPPCR